MFIFMDYRYNERKERGCNIEENYDVFRQTLYFWHQSTNGSMALCGALRALCVHEGIHQPESPLPMSALSSRCRCLDQAVECADRPLPRRQFRLWV